MSQFKQNNYKQPKIKNNKYINQTILYKMPFADLQDLTTYGNLTVRDIEFGGKLKAQSKESLPQDLELIIGNRSEAQLTVKNTLFDTENHNDLVLIKNTDFSVQDGTTNLEDSVFNLLGGNKEKRIRSHNDIQISASGTTNSTSQFFNYIEDPDTQKVILTFSNNTSNDGGKIIWGDGLLKINRLNDYKFKLNYNWETSAHSPNTYCKAYYLQTSTNAWLEYDFANSSYLDPQNQTVGIYFNNFGDNANHEIIVNLPSSDTINGNTDLSNYEDITIKLEIFSPSNTNNASQVSNVLSITSVSLVRNTACLQINTPSDANMFTNLKNGLARYKAHEHRYDVDQFHVYGTTRLSGNLTVSEATILESTLNVANNATFNQHLNVSGNSHLLGNLVVEDDTELKADLDVTGTSIMQSTLTVSGQTDLLSALNVTGLGIFESSLMVSGTTSLQSTLDVSGNTHLSGNLVVNNNTELNGELLVIDVCAMQSSLTVSQETHLGNTLDVTGATTLASTLSVGNDTIIAGGFDVMNNALFQSDVVVKGSLRVEGEITSVESTQIRIQDKIMDLGYYDSTQVGSTYGISFGAIKSDDSSNSTNPQGLLTFDSTDDSDKYFSLSNSLVIEGGENADQSLYFGSTSSGWRIRQVTINNQKRLRVEFSNGGANWLAKGDLGSDP